MPDPSELIPIVAALAVAALALLGFLRSARLAARPTRVTLRTLTAVLGAAALLVAAALLFFDLNYTRHLPPLVSPDGRHVARTTFTINTGTPADLAEVTVRSSGGPYAHSAYTGPSHFDPSAPEPEVEWQDDTHLIIRFHTYLSTGEAATPQGCAASAAGVTILCEQTRVHAVK